MVKTTKTGGGGKRERGGESGGAFMTQEFPGQPLPAPSAVRVAAAMDRPAARAGECPDRVANDQRAQPAAGRLFMQLGR